MAKEKVFFQKTVDKFHGLSYNHFWYKVPKKFRRIAAKNSIRKGNNYYDL